MKKLLFITLISLIPLANADKYFDRTTWYCAPEKSAGLRYNRLTKEYEMAKFKQEKIMLVEEKSKFDKDNWHYLKIKNKKYDNGFVTPYKYQTDDCREISGTVFCHSLSSTFTLNTDTGKATASDSYGWLTDFSDVPYSDLFVELYSCEKF